MTADWRNQAACSSENLPDIFFPTTDTGPSSEYVIAEAKAICRRCPVTTQCLTWALENHVNGIWGGLTETERRRLQRTHTAA